MKNLNCQYCQRLTELVDSSAVYRKSYGLIYFCRHCQAWVGVHKNTTKPLGQVANRKLRYFRKEAHRYFDFLWKEKLRRQKVIDANYPKKRARASAYKWLAMELHIEAKDCHIAMFSIERCNQTISLCRPLVETITQARNKEKKKRS